MPWLTIALLLLFGLLFVAAEVIFIPGTTVVGFVGFVLLVLGIWLGYRDLGTPVGHYALIGVALLAGLIVYVGLRPKNMARVALTSVNDSSVLDVRRPRRSPRYRGPDVVGAAAGRHGLVWERTPGGGDAGRICAFGQCGVRD
jgi:hypothetical protein